MHLLRCPSCGGAAKALGEVSGKTVKCPRCGAQFIAEGGSAPGRPRVPTWAWCVLGVGTICVVAVSLVVGVVWVWYLATRPAPPPPPARFDPGDVHETARWAGEILKPLNSTLEMSNRIARKETAQTELAKAKARVDPLVGRIVSWEMECSVFETTVFASPNKYGQTGDNIVIDLPSDRIALMVLNDRSERAGNPRDWAFSLDIPEQISREEARQLPERVVVTGRIKEVVIERYGDWKLEDILRSEEEQWYLLYIYLTDVKLKPIPG
jgi:hypothetical protein